MINEFDQLKQPAEDGLIQKPQFDFTGEWLPNLHPLKIGSGNYSDVSNIRYTKTGVVGVNGYTKINTNPLANINGRSGFQLRSPYTQKSYIFTRQLDSNLENGKLYVHKAAPPSVGEFATSVFHTDLSGASDGRFVEAPNNNMVYCNGVETLVYGGEESYVAAFIKASSISLMTLTNPIVFTSEIRNVLQDSLNVVSIDFAFQGYLIGSTRPLSGIKVYISSPNNGTGSVLGVKNWTGNWTPVTGLVDNTSVGSKTHSQTGTITWDDTRISINVARPALINNDLFYWYWIYASSGNGSCSIYHATVKSEIQPLVDLWDGVNRTCIQCEVSKSGIYKDYTPEVAEPSGSQYPIAASFSGLTVPDHVILMFSEQTTAVLLSFIAGFVNQVATYITVFYWNGTTWVSVGVVYDGTRDPGLTKPLAQNGTIFWDAPLPGLEHPTTLFSTYGYAYKLLWADPLTVETGTPPTTGVWVDTIYGVPAKKSVKSYKFAFNYKNRVFLAGDVSGKEGNVIDYGIKNAVDSYNGQDSSDRGKRVYVGNNDTEVVAAANVFNRFGASLYNSELVLKPSGVYLLDGDGPENYKVSQISENIGCTSPKTLVTAEISFEVTKDAIRNIALWVSPYGPMIFDAAVIVPLRGIEMIYFNPTHASCVNFNALNNAHAWFNPRYYEWNVCLPSGPGQTLCNVWLTYNLIEKKWSKIATGTKKVPQATIKVLDSYGNAYFYGLIDSGHMIKLEDGNFWDETEQIEGYIVSNFILPSGNIFDTILIRNLKLIIDCNGSYDIEYTRTDMSIEVAGIESGDLKVYGVLVEDPLCTASYYDGDNFVCKELIEGATLPGGLTWQDVGGVVSIIGVLIENYKMKITTVNGDFIAAGLIPGLLVLTSDVNNLGPFLCSSVATKTLEFETGRGNGFSAGATLTLYTMVVKVEYYDGSNYSLVPFEKWEINNRFAKFISSCNYVGMTHLFKFSFYSKALEDNIRPLAWGLQYLIERSDT